MELSNKKRNLVLIVMLVGVFISLLSQSLLTSALPSIMREFTISATMGQWLTTGYILVFGIITATTAYLINKFNTKKLFISAILLFLVGCFISIFAQNFVILIFSRVVQACGAGVLLPVTQVVILKTFPVEQHGKAMGIIGIVVGVAPAVGPTLSGLIVELGGWKSIFYLLIVISIIVVICSAFVLVDIGEKVGGRLDFLSAILYGIGFCCLMLGVTNQESYGWINYLTMGPIIAGIVCLYIFAVRQLKIREPLLLLELLKNRVFAVSTILIMVTYIAMMSGTLMVPIYIQSVRGLSALISGAVLLPGSVLLAFFSPITGYMFDKYGARTISILGMVLLAVGTGAFVFFVDETSLILVTAMYAVRMVGIAFLLMPLTAYGIGKLKGDEIAHGNAIVNSLRQMSGALGSSILIAIMGAASANSTVTDIHGVNVSFGIETALIMLGLLCTLIFIEKEQSQEKVSSKVSLKA